MGDSALELEQDADEYDEEIDVNNDEQLARKGIKRIQIEGDEENEYLMDKEGNIYDLQGNFVGSIGDQENGDVDANELSDLQ